MNFLPWHYTEGLQAYIRFWIFAFDSIIHYFSLPILLKSLFSPWKRLVLVDKTPGFNFSKFFQKLSFNFISRGVGATVRTALFVLGVTLIILGFFAGIFGLFGWLIFPPVGIPFYLDYEKRPSRFAKKLINKMRTGTNHFVKILFDNDAGKFVLTRVGLNINELVQSVKPEMKLSPGLTPASYGDLVSYFVNFGVWPKEFFQERGLKREDLELAASWWDTERQGKGRIDKRYFGRPGIGLELLFGYTPTLNQYVEDLSVPQSFSHRLIGRETVVSRMQRALSGGSSVMLTGEPGVGKRTVTLEFAHRAANGQLGRALSFKRVLEFDYNFLLSEAVDINQKKTNLSRILKEAAAAGNIILVIRDIHRLTNSEVEGLDFTDLFEERLQEGDLKIISVSTLADYERFISKNTRLRKFFETVEVVSPTKDEAMLILIESARRWEKIKDVVITISSLRKVLEGSDKYITDIPYPEKAIELLDSAVIYLEQTGKKVLTADEVNTVLSEKIGVPFSHLTEKEKVRLTNLEKIVHKRLINQDIAVSLIAKTLRAKQTGVIEDKKPLGSFLFMGPTGVGKTETAKVLARVYFGSEKAILRFDMAEYAGSEGFERLIGSISKGLPGRLTMDIKNNPASLLLLDEIEKAKTDVINLLLTLLDEGFITDAFGEKIICRHLFVIATSNAAAGFVREQVAKGVKGEELQRQVFEHVLEEGFFSPEFLNRFDGVVVYGPLSGEHLVKIAHLQLSQLAESLKKKNIYLDVTNETAEKVAKDGYNPTQGARPMRRIIDIILGDLLGRAILTGELKSGDRVEIVPGLQKDEYSWEKMS